MPPKAQPNPSPFGLTPREAEIALVAWKCVEGDFKINNNSLAAMANIGQPASAARMWRTIKAKIATNTTGTTDVDNDADVPAKAPAKAPATKKKAVAKGGKKRVKKEIDTDDDDDQDAGTDVNESDNDGKPEKKAAKRAKVEEKSPVNVEDIDGSGEA
ncbi:hypothetical protein VM1G_07796 [Cytospora mali]|uniref:Uncharacterized protein n=1 Tax=Cytospora mali TaxID=578113 RepID=A0A194W7M6_CYTMA|nr:hypothetical protein VM1G_07796 [Valsa mali]